MSEEEKNAIEILKAIDFLLDDVYSTNLITDKQRDKYQKAIYIIEELIEKQQKEIEELHKEINERVKLKIENEHLVDTQFIYKGKIEEKIKELEKQAKIEDGIGLRYSEKGKIYAQIKILKELKENTNE